MARRPLARRALPAVAAVAAAAAGSVGLAGCGPGALYSRSETAGLPTTLEAIESHDWLLVRDGSSLEIDDDSPVTLTVHVDEVSGRAPCNLYRGDFSLDDLGNVDISRLALTKQACLPRVERAEREVVGALEAVDHASVDRNDAGDVNDDVLALTGDDDLRLEFAPIPHGDD